MNAGLESIIGLHPLLTILLKMTALLGAGALLHLVLARVNPRWRVLAWRGIVVGMVALPLAEFASPRFELEVASAPVGVVTTVKTSLPGPPPLAPRPFFVPEHTPAPPLTATAPVPVLDPTPQPAPPAKDYTVEILLAAWALIALAFALRLALGARHLARMLGASRAAPTPLREAMDSVAADLGCAIAPGLRVIPEASSPFLARVFKPLLLLPERMCEPAYASERPAVFAHELAHVKNRDLFWIHAINWLTVLFWFHPLVWFLRAAHAAACEKVCDGVAAQYVGDASDSSRTLARTTLDFVVDAATPPGVPMIRSAEITRRLRALKQGIRASALRRRWVATATTIGCIALVVLGGLQFVYAAKPVAEEQVAASTEEDSPAVTFAPIENPGRLQFRLEGHYESLPYAKPTDENKTISVGKAVYFDESNIRAAFPMPSRVTTALSTKDTNLDSEYKVLIDFTGEASIRFTLFTAKNVGHKVVMVFDGKVLSAPVINAPITRSVEIAGSFTKREAETIAKALHAGKQGITVKPTTFSESEKPDENEALEPVKTTQTQPASLQERIDAAEPGAVLTIPKGTHTSPLRIEKAITLRGEGERESVIEFLGDEPALTIRLAKDVTLENLTVRWGLSPTDAKPDVPAAIGVRDATVIIRNCTLVPYDRPRETPYALMAAGRGHVTVTESTATGFAYTLFYLDGANGTVSHSILTGAGHESISLRANSTVKIHNNILADCGYHPVRNTGGTMEMTDNLVANTPRAGAYLGKRSAHGFIRNNLFTNTNGGIWGYARSDVVVENNLFMNAKDVGLSFRDSCRLTLRRNSIVNNPKGIVRWIQNDPPGPGATLEGNHYWNSGENHIDVPPDPHAIEGDPLYIDAASGNFAPQQGSPLIDANGNIRAGLSNPETIHRLWQIWKGEDTEAIETAAPSTDAEKRFTVFGRVIGGDGRPMAGAEVRAATGWGTLWGGGSTTTGEDGTYRLDFGPGVMFKNETTGDSDEGLQVARITAIKTGFFEQDLSRHGNLFMSSTKSAGEDNSIGATAENTFLPLKPRRIDFVMVREAVNSGSAETTPRLQFRLEGDEETLEFAKPKENEETIAVGNKIYISESGIKSAVAREDAQRPGRYMILFNLTSEAAQQFHVLTGENIGKRLAIVFDGKVVTAPNINQTISGSGEITGEFTKEEAETVANVLNAGKKDSTAKTGSVAVSIPDPPVQFMEGALIAIASIDDRQERYVELEDMDERGGAEFSNLAPGQYRVSVFYARNGYTEETFTLAAGDELELTLSKGPSRLAGIIRGAEGRTTRQSLTWELTWMPTDMPVRGFATINEDGEYEIDGLQPGSYRLIYKGENSMHNEFEVTVEEGDNEFNFELPATRIDGQIVGFDYESLYDKRRGSYKNKIEVMPPDGVRTAKGTLAASVYADKEGRFYIEHLPVGDYIVKLRGLEPNGLLKTHVRIAGSTDQVNVELRPQSKVGELTGKVRGMPEDTSVLRLFNVEAHPLINDKYEFTVAYQAKVDLKMGAYRIQNLPEGRYGLHFYSYPEQFVPDIWKPVVDVRDDQVHELDIDIPNGRLVKIVLDAGTKHPKRSRWSLRTSDGTSTPLRRIGSGNPDNNFPRAREFMLPFGEYIIEAEFGDGILSERAVKVEEGVGVQEFVIPMP